MAPAAAGGLLAPAAADLVAEHAADHGAGHGAAHVAVLLRQTLLHDHVLADFLGHGGLGGLAHRLGADHGGVQPLPLVHRLDLDDLRVLQQRRPGRLHLVGGGIGRIVDRQRRVGSRRRCRGDHRLGVRIAVVHERSGGDASDQQGTGCYQDGSGLLHGPGSPREPPAAIGDRLHHGQAERNTVCRRRACGHGGRHASFPVRPDRASPS